MIPLLALFLVVEFRGSVDVGSLAQSRTRITGITGITRYESSRAWIRATGLREPRNEVVTATNDGTNGYSYPRGYTA